MENVNPENTVKSLVNAALAEENPDRACDFLRRARELQKVGTLDHGHAFAIDSAKAYFRQRREMLLTSIAAGEVMEKPPTLTELARQYGCSLSTVHALKKEYLTREARRR